MVHWGQWQVLIPPLLLQLSLIGAALTDLMRREHARSFSRPVWVVLIIMFSIVGPTMYLLYGREE